MCCLPLRTYSWPGISCYAGHEKGIGVPIGSQIGLNRRVNSPKISRIRPTLPQSAPRTFIRNKSERKLRFTTLLPRASLDGSTGATFYQHHPFCSGQNIWILRPKPEMIQDFDQFIALYLVASIRKAVRNYTYNLSLTKSRLLKVEVLVPTVDGRFDADLARQRIKALRNSSLIESIPFHRIFE